MARLTGQNNAKAVEFPSIVVGRSCRSALISLRIGRIPDFTRRKIGNWLSYRIVMGLLEAKLAREAVPRHK